MGPEIGAFEPGAFAAVAEWRLKTRLRYPATISWDGERQVLYVLDSVLARVFAILP